MRTVTSGSKSLPHWVTFMGQGNQMAPAAGSRSTPATSVFLCLTLIILKACGMPSSNVFMTPISQMHAIPSQWASRLPSLLCCPPSCAWFVLSSSPSASIFLGEPGGVYSFEIYCPDWCTCHLHPAFTLVTELHNLFCLQQKFTKLGKESLTCSHWCRGGLAGTIPL